MDLAHCVEDVGYMLQERKKEFEEIPDDGECFFSSSFLCSLYIISESKTSAKSSIQEIVNLKSE